MAKSIIAQHIEERSSSAIRSRANQIEIKELMLDDDNKIAYAKVFGSQGNVYNIHIRNYQSNDIATNCNCPYDWNGMCKHEVAVLKHIDKRVNKSKPASKGTVLTKKKKQVSKFSKTAAYIIKPFTAIDDQMIYEHMGIHHRYYVNINENSVKLHDNIIKYTLPLNDNYWANSFAEVVIEHKKDSLILTCDCDATNIHLCKHQFAALNHVKNELSPYYFDKEYKTKQWEEQLERYGYTLDDDYEKLFNSSYEDGEFVIEPKVEGLMPIIKADTLKVFSNQLVSRTSIEDYLHTINKSKEKQKLKLAVGLGFDDNQENVPISAKLLIGKPNKSGELSSKIEELDGLEYIGNIDSTLETIAKSYQLALPLSDNNISNLYYQFDARDKSTLNSLSMANHVLGLLSKMITELDASIDVYRLIENNNYGYRITKKDIERIKLNKQSTNIEFLFTEEEEFYKLECYILLGTKKIKLPNKRISNANFFAIIDGEYYLHKSADYIATFNFFMGTPVQRIKKSELENYLTNFLLPLQKKYNVVLDIASVSTQNRALQESELSKQVYMSEVDDFVVFKPIIAVNNRLLELGDNSSYSTKENDVITYHSVSDSFVAQFENEMLEIHPDFAGQGQNDGLFLTFEQFGDKRWFLDAFEHFKEKNIEVFGYDKFKKVKYNEHKPNITVGVSSEIDWFDVSIAVSFGEQILSLNHVKKAVLKQESYVKLDDGSYGYLPEEWLQKMERYFRYGEVSKDGVSISKHHFSLIEELYDEIDDEALKDEIEEKKNKLIAFESIKDLKKPKGIKAKLRDYQMHGYNWLSFLNEFKMGGCLADDMGLGKTLQVICLLQEQKNLKVKIPSLIVLPTSLIFNWQNEVEKFAPKLKVKVISGAKRSKETKDYKKYDIILITYGLILRDIDYLKDYQFNYAILDESQAIKNPNSKRYKSVRLLKAHHRIVMTGTPVENSTMDLYSQMSFVNPGLLGSATFFRDHFAKAIEKDKDEEKTEELKKLIKPFLIRRTKEQVATELPDKTEMTLYCELEPAQKKVYDTFRDKYKNYLLGKIEDEGLGKSKMYVLEGLMKLRQICNSPALLADKEDYGNESIKIKELLTHIRENTGQHKILVFSQFVKMLNLIKTALDEEQVEYEYLDGKTKNRQERVNNFQHNDKVRVFLISLKAGGTGLNLTSADYVYIIDPWWNPAVEAQAIDRCYRIGQDKHVMAYKMICKGTVEEKIVELQERKMKLVKDIVSTDDSILKSLSKSDIEDLFS